ncbi:hypothetical protein D7D52_09420 [Nocardia yunnanensis]|uniref:Uncharacterized protein n=1 Tax=Nocardia yunnanensis TaxID=2382165 RepID=A0A386Z8W0_9NOCA|nr:hypothetical protein [Nocardia yunnanensis]AYF74048.1 hypothetical protein D7D52_09420 [Nocardia yunnanensis]
MTSTETIRRPALVAAIRAVAALTVVGSAAAATTLTVRADERVPTVVVVGEQQAAATQSADHVTVAPTPADPLGAAGSSAPAAAPAPSGAAPAAAVPLNSGGQAPGATVQIGQSNPPGAATPSGPAANPDSATPLGAADPFAIAPVNTQPACPLGWPAPAQQGGLASLIGLAPLAGPFSSEAFALGSVYQPILQLVGPVLAEISPIITRYQPLIDPIIAQVQGVEAIVLQAILPYYGPYRSQLIAAEGDLAKALAPALNNVYNSEIASCFVAWQGQLIDQAKGGRITVASLAHPGAVVELGPEA